MDERTIDKESLKTMTDDELRRLGNALHYTESVEASWMVQEEIVRRKQESSPVSTGKT